LINLIAADEVSVRGLTELGAGVGIIKFDGMLTLLALKGKIIQSAQGWGHELS
jgi:hypothetical protein